MRKKLAILFLIMVFSGAMMYILPGAIMRVFAASGTSASFGGSMGGWTGATINGIVANLSRIDSMNTSDSADDTWENDTVYTGGIDFVNMAFDDRWKVFRNRYYYAIDIGPAGAIAPSGGWGVTVTPTGSFASIDRSVQGIGDTIVLAVVKQTGDKTTDPNFTVNLPVSNGGVSRGGLHVPDTGFAAPSGWLRLYLGVYGGAANNSADYIPGANPISAGDYGNLSGGIGAAGITVSFTGR